MASGCHDGCFKFRPKPKKSDDDSSLKSKGRDSRDEFFLSNGAELLEKLIEFSHSRCSPIRIFSAEELKKVTNNFAETCEISDNSSPYNIYYKGNLEGRAITVNSNTNTLMEPSSRINEVAILSRINHPNVVKFVGCCLETSTPMLVFGELPNQTLSWGLHGAGPSGYIPWQNRLKIVTEIAHALAYMHIGTATPIIHGYIKPSNVLLGECFAVKIVGFELSKSVPLGEIKIACDIVSGTLGYLDPLFAMHGELSDKSDVYSYGVLLLEVLTGKKFWEYLFREEGEIDKGEIEEDSIDGHNSLLNIFGKRIKEKVFVSFMDSRVVQEAKKEQLTACLRLAERCIGETWEERPEMKGVVQELWRIRGL